MWHGYRHSCNKLYCFPPGAGDMGGAWGVRQKWSLAYVFLDVFLFLRINHMTLKIMKNWVRHKDISWWVLCFVYLVAFEESLQCIATLSSNSAMWEESPGLAAGTPGDKEIRSKQTTVWNVSKGKLSIPLRIPFRWSDSILSLPFRNFITVGYRQMRAMKSNAFYILHAIEFSP